MKTSDGCTEDRNEERLFSSCTVHLMHLLQLLTSTSVSAPFIQRHSILHEVLQIKPACFPFSSVIISVQLSRRLHLLDDEEFWTLCLFLHFKAQPDYCPFNPALHLPKHFVGFFSWE